MISEQSNILKRQEQLTKWFASDTDKASKSIKEAAKIKFSNEIQFLSACNSNDWPEIERLLNIGININCTQDDGLTSLHQACIDDDENLVKYLIDHGAEIDVQDKEGWTPLFAAISCNYLPIIKHLLCSGARLDIVSFDGELPLDQTTNEVLISLLQEEMSKRNLDPHEIRNRERNAILRDIEEMKNTHDFSKFTLADNGGSLLHIAASKDYGDVLEQLLDIISPEQLNHTDNEGWNALHVAAHWGNKNACLLLVDADIDFDRVTANNKTVLEVSDHDAKPYIREEIRKARFRRQDRAAFKRPATSPNIDFKPSETKIICQDKDPKLPVDEIPKQSNFNEQISTSHDSVSDSSQHNTPIDCAQSTNSVDLDVTASIDETHPKNIVLNSEIKTSDSSTEVSVNDSKENIQVTETNDVTPSQIIAPSVPALKVVESESQRKDKARHVRSTRKLTQGVSAEDIEEAMKLNSTKKVDDLDKSPANSKCSNGGDDVTLSTFNHIHDKDTENKSETQTVNSKSDKAIPTIQITDQSLNGDTHKSVLTEKNSDPTEANIPARSITESADQSELKKKSGSHLVNKRKTRERQPTGTVDPKDVQTAQQEFVQGNEINKFEDSLKPMDTLIDYKALYENELKEKEKLQRNLSRMSRELEQSQNRVKDLQNNHVTLQSQVAVPLPSDCDKTAIERLREENKKMKEANSALIRVISRLSHPQLKSLSNSS